MSQVSFCRRSTEVVAIVPFGLTSDRSEGESATDILMARSEPVQTLHWEP